MTALANLETALDLLEDQSGPAKKAILDAIDAYTIAQTLGIGAVTASATEINYNATAVAGTAKASKTAVLGANKNLDEFHTAKLYIGAAAGTEVTATAAQLNTNAGVTAGASSANKAAVLGATMNLDVLALPVGGLKIGVAGAETPITCSAAELNVLTGIAATLTAAELSKLDGVTAIAAELNLLDGIPAVTVITHAGGAANIVNVTFTVNDAAGAPVAKPTFLDIWLSDAATGLAITAHPADSITATAGSIWHVNTAACAVRVQTTASGVATLAITDTHKTAFYVCAALGFDGYADIHLLAGGDYT